MPTGISLELTGFKSLTIKLIPFTVLEEGAIIFVILSNYPPDSYKKDMTLIYAGATSAISHIHSK
jgi:hypothetical protein